MGFASSSVNPIIDLGSVVGALVASNSLNGFGTATGIYVCPQAQETGIGPNLIRGCPVPIVNEGVGTSITGQL
jgi:hypothetical protein